MWHSWSGRSAQALDVLARRYEREQPHVRISLRAYPAATLMGDYSAGVADGSAPQLLLILSRYLGELVDRGHVLSMPQPVETSLADALPAALDSVRVGGQLRAVPLAYDSLVLFYDRRKIAEPPASFEQLLALTPAPADPPAGDAAWGLGYYLSAATTLPYLRAFDGAILTADGAVALDGDRRRGTIRWLEWLQSLRSDPRALVTDDFSTVDSMIQSGRVAASIDWLHRRPAYEQLWGAESVGIGALPAIEGQAAAVPPSLLLADVAAVNSATAPEQRDAALSFLLYLASPPAQEILWRGGGRAPVSQSAAVDGVASSTRALSLGGMAFPNTAADSWAWPLLDEMVRSVLSGSATPSEAIDIVASSLRERRP